MKNCEIAKILREMAAFYEMDDVAFKPRAYEKAAQGIESADQELSQIYATRGTKGFFEIPGVGQGIADHLAELFQIGKLKKYEQFKKKYPIDLGALLNIEAVGPKTAKALYQKLGVRTVADLKRALDAGKVAAIPGFGKKSQEKILAGLKFAQKSGGRFLLGDIFLIVAELTERLENSKLFSRIMVGGSFRRRQETVGDIDILAVSTTARQAMDFFVALPGVASVLEHGETKSEIRLENGIQVDLRIVLQGSWGAAAQYFTGDKAHNIKLRKIAIAKGYKLSEYGLTHHHPPSRGGKERGVIVDSEEKVYKALGMDFIPPELRTDSGEIEAAQARELPKLLEYGSVRGDLQTQTNWTDGESSIAEMAEAAQKLGREYIAITDHTKTLYMTGGLDEKKLLKQMVEIDQLNKSFKLQASSFKILKGAEVNILKDGSLDIADEVLAKLDIVGVSIHTNMKMTPKEMTKRICRALSNPNVDIFFHPTTRIINKRPPIEFDFEEILWVARKNRVALEINASPERLDIHDTLIRQAVAAGVKLVIDSDAHEKKHLGYLHFGEAQARRGWATKNDVLNTGAVEELLKYFNS